MKIQLGFTILLLTVTLLLISTLLILFSAQYSSLQFKITGNLYKNQQAFEAAEAGVEAAIPYFMTNYAAIVATASGGYLQPYMNANTQNVVQANSSKYTFVFSNPTANNYQLITITSTGTNADGSSSRIITQQIDAYSGGTPPPLVTLETQGSVFMFNNSQLNNTMTNSNINAGGTVNLYNSADTTTSSGTSSTTSKLGSDVQQNNSALSSMSTTNFFQSVFGTNESTVQSKANYTYTGNGIDSYDKLNGVTGSVIWINEPGIGYTDGSTTIGSPSKPVVLIVSGNMLFLDNTTIYGLVFVMNSGIGTFFLGNTTVNGAVVSSNDLFFTNNATENYNSTLLNALPSVGGASSYAKLPASWRDF